MKFFLYILHSKTFDRYYTGVSSDPERRLLFHNSIEKGFTSKYRPWEIVFVKEFQDKASAMIVERKIKSWKSKKRIKDLLNKIISI
jgi:putative endonuclease